jgi:hypothetical protein
MWKISEGDTKFSYAIKLVPQEYYRVSGPKSVKEPKNLNANLSQCVSVRRCLKGEWRQPRRRRRRRRSLYKLIKTNFVLYKHFKAHTTHLKLYDK